MASGSEVTYRFVIENQGGGQGNSGTANIGLGKMKTPTAPSNDSIGFASSLNAFMKSAPAGFALKLLNTAISAQISTVELRTGSATLQEQIQFKYSIAKNAAAVGIATLASIATGNPLPLIAVAGQGINQLTNIAIAQNELNLRRRIEDINISFANIRAGAGGNRAPETRY